MSADSQTSMPVSKSETDSKRKVDDSTVPTVPRENLDRQSQVEQNAHQECSWSICSKVCLLQEVQPKDVCSVEGCQSVFHHMCPREWEIYQYHYWTTPMVTHRIAFMIQAERSVAL